MFVHLIIGQAHFHHHHVDPPTLMGILSAKFYLMSMRRAMRSVARSCRLSFKLYSRSVQQQTGQLPSDRLTPSLLFFVTGIDFAGPFTTKRGTVRQEVHLKRYQALVVCFSTRVVHPKVVSDLSADSVIGSLRKFVYSRGLPQTIYTAHGTNFFAVDSDLKAAYALLDIPPTKKRVAAYLVEHRVTWKRIPRRAPKFGGLWETTVHSPKLLLKKAT